MRRATEETDIPPKRKLVKPPGRDPRLDMEPPIRAEDLILTEDRIERQHDSYDDLDMPYPKLQKVYLSLYEECQTEIQKYLSLERKRRRIMESISELRARVSFLGGDSGPPSPLPSRPISRK